MTENGYLQLSCIQKYYLLSKMAPLSKYHFEKISTFPKSGDDGQPLT